MQIWVPQQGALLSSLGHDAGPVPLAIASTSMPEQRLTAKNLPCWGNCWDFGAIVRNLTRQQNGPMTQDSFPVKSSSQHWVLRHPLSMKRDIQTSNPLWSFPKGKAKQEQIVFLKCRGEEERVTKGEIGLLGSSQPYKKVLLTSLNEDYFFQILPNYCKLLHLLIVTARQLNIVTLIAQEWIVNGFNHLIIQ